MSNIDYQSHLDAALSHIIRLAEGGLPTPTTSLEEANASMKQALQDIITECKETAEATGCALD